jgi:hypothetical protein
MCGAPWSDSHRREGLIKNLSDDFVTLGDWEKIGFDLAVLVATIFVANDSRGHQDDKKKDALKPFNQTIKLLVCSIKFCII